VLSRRPDSAAPCREEKIFSRGKRGWIKKRRSFAARDDSGGLNQRDNANRRNRSRDIAQRHSYPVSRILRLEDPLKSSEYGRLEYHAGHFAVPGNPMQHFDHVVVHLRRVVLELLQQYCRGFDDLYVGEPSNQTALLTKSLALLVFYCT